MIFFSTNAMPFKTDTVGFIDISSNVCVAFSSSSFGYLMLSSPHSFSRYEKQIFPQMAQSFMGCNSSFFEVNPQLVEYRQNLGRNHKEWNNTFVQLGCGSSVELLFFLFRKFITCLRKLLKLEFLFLLKHLFTGARSFLKINRIDFFQLFKDSLI